MEFEIQPLSKEKYEGYCFKAEYITNHYYDVVMLENGFQLILKEFDKPIRKEFKDSLFASWLEEPIVFGAFIDEKLIGFVEGSKETWHNLFRISNIFILDEYRGFGIGEALLSYMIEYVKNKKEYRGIILETQTCNYVAISLYKKLGFKLCRIDTHEYSNHDVENKEVRIDLLLELEKN